MESNNWVEFPKMVRQKYIFNIDEMIALVRERAVDTATALSIESKLVLMTKTSVALADLGTEDIQRVKFRMLRTPHQFELLVFALQTNGIQITGCFTLGLTNEKKINKIHSQSLTIK